MGAIDKQQVRKQYQRHETDTGSSDVQVALLSKRIELLTEHLKKHRKDHSSRFGLISLTYCIVILTVLEICVYKLFKSSHFLNRILADLISLKT